MLGLDNILSFTVSGLGSIFRLTKLGLNVLCLANLNLDVSRLN